MAAFLNLTKPQQRGRKFEPQPASQLGTASLVKGVLDSEGVVEIHGTFHGRINADCLILGAMGNIEGDIVAREVRIAGRLLGRIFALTVTLEETADVTGRIFHNAVTVARGARFEGRMPWRPANYFETLDQLPETQP